MLQFDPEVVNPRQDRLILIAALIFFVVGCVGALIADRPKHPGWFDDIGLIQVFWDLIWGGLFGVTVGGGIIAWCAVNRGGPAQKRFDNFQNRKSEIK